ncbi:gamma-aminobutyric acid receptor-associated protein-like 2 isoform X2 [Hyla sarda]|nr:gamma-aminobutyric acid receptor-associated protein-like 2 isoform X2 [Hyla sarda]XP_056424431.1 gamma-aminobutyric acid receptor-associated protein-like 2 isoform X2 [Hyla sarda]XP_056424432.1 gamma-aminobutyric acid receptor-associated protein-like 2 isoform X2 [Hyla sarda]
MWKFKEDHTLEYRCTESAKIKAKHPNHVPVIIEKVPGSKIGDMKDPKKLVPSDIPVALFKPIIRKHLQMPSQKPLFLFVNAAMPPPRLTMGQLYEREKDEDGILYMAYGGEKTFGEKKNQRRLLVMIEDVSVDGDVCVV